MSQSPGSILDGIRVASPCQASWEAMTGDDRQRACQACGKPVYNLSALTAAEALDLVAQPGPRPCIRFYQRLDGTMLTSDCPVGARTVRQRRRVRQIAGLSVGLALVSTVAAALGLRRVSLAPIATVNANLDLTPPAPRATSPDPGEGDWTVPHRPGPADPLVPVEHVPTRAELELPIIMGECPAIELTPAHVPLARSTGPRDEQPLPPH